MIPCGELVTLPVPGPVIFTVSDSVKVAVMFFDPSILTTHIFGVPRKVLHPLHPLKLLPAFGLAVNLTSLLTSKLTVQVGGQLIPGGSLATVPSPEVETLRPN